MKDSQRVKEILYLFCKLNVLYPVTDKYPKPFQSNPHTQLHFPTVYCVCVFVWEDIFRMKFSFGYLLQKFLYFPLPCLLAASSHLIIFFIFLPQFVAFLITTLPIILFHSILLALPLFTSRYPPCNTFLSDTLSHTPSLNMRYKPHTHTKNSYVLLIQLL